MATLAITDAQYVSQYAQDTFGVITHVNGVVADVDSNLVTATFRDADGNVVFARPADHLDTGKYGTSLTSDDSSVPGIYTITFSYTVGSVPDSYTQSVEIGVVAPAYDALPDNLKTVVEQTWIRFADLYDSPYGGPHLQVYMQSHFGRQRLSQLLLMAVNRLNVVAQPQTFYVVDQWPVDKWGGLLEQALYVEVLKHLVRSYVEQPEVVLGAAVSRFDRRDYMNRWQSVLDTELEDLKLMQDNFKIAHMGLGNVSVLVSGGAYGNWGPTAYPAGAGEAAARGYYFYARYMG